MFRCLVVAPFLLPSIALAQLCGSSAVSVPPPQCDDLPALRGAAETKAPYSCGKARTFFVDFPMFTAAPSETPTTLAQMGGAVIAGGTATLSVQQSFGDALAQAVGAGIVDPGSWFCRPCDQLCHQTLSAEGFAVEARAVLQPRGPGGRRDDGHRRFWRFEIFSPLSGHQYEVLPGFNCSAVELLRAEARKLAPAYGVSELDDMKIGRRACVVTPMADPQWHRDAIEMPGAPGPWLADPDQPVLALLDSGVDFGQHPNALEVDYVGSGQKNEHGTAMAGLMRQIAPQGAAALNSHRVLPEGSGGTIEDLARGIDDALFDEHRPTILNLSLAWLPEYERRRSLKGFACGEDPDLGRRPVYEDGIGEAIRYLLTSAREMDSTARPILAVASAGNRPLDNEGPDSFDAEAGQGRMDRCTAGWWQGTYRSPMLFPAEYARTQTTTAACAAAGPLALPVGAVDRHGQRSGVSIPDPMAEPTLVAPGQHVVAPLPNAGQPDSHYTGTSVSAALTSAAAARFLSVVTERRLAGEWIPGFDGATLSEILWMTARGLQRGTIDGDVRHLHVGALDTLARCPWLADALSCLSEGEEGCEEVLGWCEAQPEPTEIDPSFGEMMSPRTSCQEPGLSAFESVCSLENDWRSCDASQVAGAPLSFRPQPANAPADRVRGEALGQVGPQPGGVPCPDCRVGRSLSWYGTWASVDLAFSTKFGSTTRFTSPYLLLEQFGVKKYAKITSGTISSGWKPGQKVYISGISVPWSVKYFNKATLVVTVTQNGKYAGVMSSPLYLK